ncbi:tRNA (uracil(54)-C(5))-methyltransferase [[Candida] railenensis]|uniref:tRNA (Uracil(54)-C(5))-methyltransferase n=1 Tax=[Candida] railenensis TaxID=45579 RepID=A0A9P0VZ74_9ASCO|nr:tRNA (uracil(54)-C(5))-methyltransferase [[Candida] railenensis]
MFRYLSLIKSQGGNGGPGILRRSFQTESRRPNLKKFLKKTKRDTVDHTSRDSILQKEIAIALQQASTGLTLEDIKISDANIKKFLFSRDRPKLILEDVPIIYQTSEGDGLGIAQTDEGNTMILKIAKTIPGDRVKVEIKRNYEYYAEGLALSLNKKSQLRKDDLILCEKFDVCSGCQLQMLPYDEQLNFKRNIIKRAFNMYYPELKLDEDIVVVDSPFQYSYRTKLTPHSSYLKHDRLLRVGFNGIDHRSIVDITNCPIASRSINNRLPSLRQSIRNKIITKLDNNERIRDETYILRESIRVDHKTGEFDNVCLTDYKNVVTEKIEDNVFQFPASEFFQNNNSILPEILNYVKYHLHNSGAENLVDTYCGSGFFAISLSKEISGKVFGIEISNSSIKYATHNAKLNGIQVPDKIQFIQGKADEMFHNAEFLNSGIKGDNSVVIMDPSRKGSNDNFLKQLLEFEPEMIIYISCNVFTQARDLANFAKLQDSNSYYSKYRVKDITGFDFFPQTKHVETVSVLEKV